MYFITKVYKKNISDLEKLSCNAAHGACRPVMILIANII